MTGTVAAIVLGAVAVTSIVADLAKTWRLCKCQEELARLYLTQQEEVDE